MTCIVLAHSSCNKKLDNEVVISPTAYDSLSLVYYVDDKKGNDNNTGRALNEAWKTIQAAANKATQGSTVYIREGYYYENLVMNVTGNEPHPVTFSNYKNEIVVVDGTKTKGNTLLTIIDKSYINIHRLISKSYHE
ncbi:MAG: hypothetical protein NVS3B19_10010 [Ginsengibacter sp.]